MSDDNRVDAVETGDAHGEPGSEPVRDDYHAAGAAAFGPPDGGPAPGAGPSEVRPGPPPDSLAAPKTGPIYQPVPPHLGVRPPTLALPEVPPPAPTATSSATSSPPMTERILPPSPSTLPAVQHEDAGPSSGRPKMAVSYDTWVPPARSVRPSREPSASTSSVRRWQIATIALAFLLLAVVALWALTGNGGGDQPPASVPTSNAVTSTGDATTTDPVGTAGSTATTPTPTQTGG